MLRTLLAGGMMAASLLLATPTLADSHGSMPCSSKERMQHMIQMLQLTPEQQQKIKAIKDKNMTTIRESWKQIKELRSQIKGMITTNKVDETALDKLIQQKSALMSTLTKTKIMTKNEIYNLLTDQQKQQYQEMMQKWEEKKAMFKKECHG